jgi:hypothetical protein
MGVEALLRNGSSAYTSPTEVASQVEQSVPEATWTLIVVTITAASISAATGASIEGTIHHGC